MQINIYKDPMQKAYLFGTAVLYSEKPIPREDVPQHWSSYELRGTVQRPDTPYALEDQASYNFAGSILSPLPLKADSAKSRLLKGKFELTSEYVRLAEFCSEYQIPQPQTPIRHMFRPASSTESGLFIMKTSSQEGTAKQPASKGRQGMKHMSGGKPPCIWLPAKSLETF